MEIIKMDELTIPAFLRAGSPERAAAIARGRELKRRTPQVSKAQSRAPASSTGYRKTKDKHKCTESTFYILKSLGWTEKIINRLSEKAANQYADGGVKMQAIHEVSK